jgi:hypothetical protein
MSISDLRYGDSAASMFDDLDHRAERPAAEGTPVRRIEAGTGS